MKRHLVLVLATFGLCVAASTARADYPEFEPAPGQPVYENTAPRMPLVAATCKATKDFAQSCGVLCYAHHNGEIGCSNLVSELRYVFGSCHVWWGEKCMNCPRTGEPCWARPGCSEAAAAAIEAAGVGGRTGTGCGAGGCR